MNNYAVTIDFTEPANSPEEAVLSILRYLNNNGVNDLNFEVIDEAGDITYIDATEFELDEILRDDEEEEDGAD